MTDQHKQTYHILRVLFQNTSFHHLMDMIGTLCSYYVDTSDPQRGRDYKKLAEACEELAARAKRYDL